MNVRASDGKVALSNRLAGQASAFPLRQDGWSEGLPARWAAFRRNCSQNATHRRELEYARGAQLRFGFESRPLLPAPGSPRLRPGRVRRVSAQAQGRRLPLSVRRRDPVSPQCRAGSPGGSWRREGQWNIETIHVRLKALETRLGDTARLFGLHSYCTTLKRASPRTPGARRRLCVKALGARGAGPGLSPPSNPEGLGPGVTLLSGTNGPAPEGPGRGRARGGTRRGQTVGCLGEFGGLRVGGPRASYCGAVGGGEQRLAALWGR